MRDRSEEELDRWMSRLSHGEREAFDPLFRALFPRAVRLARARLPEDQSADAAQSILMKVFARASEFQSGKPVLPWFYAIAANEIHTVQRRQEALRRRTVGEVHAHDLTAGEDPERLLLERELRGCLGQALASLDAVSAEAIGSMLEDGPRPATGGAALRKRVSRAYARLRLLLGGLGAT